MTGEKSTNARSVGAAEEEKGYAILGRWGLDPFDMWGQTMRGGNLGRTPQTPIEFWMSMFPTAPVFGVRWMMWDLVQGGTRAAETAERRTSTFKEQRERQALEMTSLRDEARPVAVKGKAKAAQIETQTSGGKPELVAVDVKALDAESRRVEARDGEEEARKEEARKEAAALERVRVKPVPTNAAVGAIRSGSGKGGKGGEERRLRLVQNEEPTAQKPKGLMRKKPAKVSDLKQIKGVGPSLEGLLNDLGIYQFAQIAKFSEAELLWVDAHLPSFKGRVLRDDWKGQASDLMAAEKK